MMEENICGHGDRLLHSAPPAFLAAEAGTRNGTYRTVGVRVSSRTWADPAVVKYAR